MSASSAAHLDSLCRILPVGLKFGHGGAAFSAQGLPWRQLGSWLSCVHLGPSGGRVHSHTPSELCRAPARDFLHPAEGKCVGAVWPDRTEHQAFLSSQLQGLQGEVQVPARLLCSSSGLGFQACLPAVSPRRLSPCALSGVPPCVSHDDPVTSD